MNILVTGGCGYIGSHTVWALVDRGHDVTVLDDLSTGARENLPPAARLIIGDVGDSALLGRALRERRIEAIIHFAGKILPSESLANPLLYFASNTAKSITLLQAAITEAVPYFLFSSTAAVYAPLPGPRVDESSPTIPLTPYGQSKLMTEDVLRASANAHRIKTIALRYFNVAGNDPALRCGPAGENPGHLIRTAVEVATGRRPYLEVFGADYNTPDGTCIRDYIHVSDLADAHIAALAMLASSNALAFSAMNCGYGRGTSVLEVISAFERVLGRGLPYRIAERRPGDAPALVADSTQLRSSQLWTPRYDNVETIITSALGWANAQRP